MKLRAWTGASGCWRDEGAPRRGVACAVRALATRGRRRGHAARELCSGRPLKNGRFSFVRNTMAEPDSAFSR